MMNLWLTPKQSLRRKYWITTRKDWQLKTFSLPGGAGPWLSDLKARGSLGRRELRGENCQSDRWVEPQSGAICVSYEWGIIWGRCQVIIPMGEAEREKKGQKERINSSCWLQCSAWSFLFVEECRANIFSKFWSESSHLATRRMWIIDKTRCG